MTTLNEKIEHPKPLFCLLMGLPASGKSTFRKNFSRSLVQLSTDDLVEDLARWRGTTYSAIWSDEIKGATSQVQAALKDALDRRASIMWDQTNLGEKKRRACLSQVPDGYHKIIVVVRCDEDERQERLKNRPGKEIPAGIDKSMRENMTMPTLAEGWDEILYLDTSSEFGV